MLILIGAEAALASSVNAQEYEEHERKAPK